jgi:hypothetical protein
MAKNKNYYISVTAEAMFKDNSTATINGYVQLKPGWDKVLLTDELSKVCGKKFGLEPKEVIITSLSEISRGLYNRLNNLE